MIPGFPMGLNKSVEKAGPGQQVFSGSYSSQNTQTVTTWQVPNGVTSISVVCVGAGGSPRSYGSSSGGGGALAYTNNIPVSSYSVVTVKAGNSSIDYPSGDTEVLVDGVVVCLAKAGVSHSEGTPVGGSASLCIGDAAYSGGTGGGGGGGAAGYSGDGGDGAVGGSPDFNESERQVGQNGQGGGGGGGGTLWVNYNGSAKATGIVGPGGGVGLEGEGTSGGGGGGALRGYAGTSGDTGSPGTYNSYGGGGGIRYSSGYYPNHEVRRMTGHPGGARIIWGPGRSYPNNAEDVY